MTPGAQLKIADNVQIPNAMIAVEKGSCIIVDNSKMGSSDCELTRIIINVCLIKRIQYAVFKVHNWMPSINIWNLEHGKW